MNTFCQREQIDAEAELVDAAEVPFAGAEMSDEEAELDPLMNEGRECEFI